MGVGVRGLLFPLLFSRGSRRQPSETKREMQRNEAQCGTCKYYSEMKVYGDEGGDEEESRAFGGERRGLSKYVGARFRLIRRFAKKARTPFDRRCGDDGSAH